MTYDNRYDLNNNNDFIHDRPTEVTVSVAIAAAVDNLPDHFIRSRDMEFNRAAKTRIANKLILGQVVTPGDIESAIIKNNTSNTMMTKVELAGGWSEKRYNVAFVVNIAEYNGNQLISRTTRTVMGWVTDEPHPVHGFADDAVININSVVTRDSQDNGFSYGTIRGAATFTGKSSDEYMTADKKVLIGSNIANKIIFESDFDKGNPSGGFTATIVNDTYSADTKATSLNSSVSRILTESINDSLFSRSNEPIGGNADVDEFVLLLNSFTVNHMGHQSGLKSFTWRAFKNATKWSKVNRLEVFDQPAAPIFNPLHATGSMESIEHDTRDVAINDIGFPLTHGVCSVIDKYGLLLINASFNWIQGSEPVSYVTIVRPLDNSELPPIVVSNIEKELNETFRLFTNIMGVQSIEVVFDGGFGKSSGISLRVNGDPTPIPLVVSPALTSLFNESVVEAGDDRMTNATIKAISNIMREHGMSAGGYEENVSMGQPLLMADNRGHNIPMSHGHQLENNFEDRGAIDTNIAYELKHNRTW